MMYLAKIAEELIILCVYCDKPTRASAADRGVRPTANSRNIAVNIGMEGWNPMDNRSIAKS
jgi:hypothetical protein